MKTKNIKVIRYRSLCPQAGMAYVYVFMALAVMGGMLGVMAANTTSGLRKSDEIKTVSMIVTQAEQIARDIRACADMTVSNESAIGSWGGNTTSQFLGFPTSVQSAEQSGELGAFHQEDFDELNLGPGPTKATFSGWHELNKVAIAVPIHALFCPAFIANNERKIMYNNTDFSIPPLIDYFKIYAAPEESMGLTPKTNWKYSRSGSLVLIGIEATDDKGVHHLSKAKQILAEKYRTVICQDGKRFILAVEEFGSSTEPIIENACEKLF